MSISALMEAMAAAGAPMEAIVLAVRALEEKDAEIAALHRHAATIREKARDKKRAQRAEARDTAGTVPGPSRDTAGTVPGPSRDTAGTVPDTSPSPSPFLPPDPQLTPTHTPVSKTPARKAPAGHRLPDDWCPEPLTGDTGKATAKWPPGALDRELLRFRDWAASATGPNARKSDWQAAWRNWVRKADDEGRYRNAELRGGRSPSSRPNDGFLNALHEAASYYGTDH